MCVSQLTLIVLKSEYSRMTVNTMTADDLAPYVARSSAAMALIMQHEHLFVFQQKGFKLLAPSSIEIW